MTDKYAFSQRLQEAMKKCGLKPTPTVLALQFNTLFDADPITANTARKWLLGLSLPRLDQIEVLTILLNVPTNWMVLGGDLDAEELTNDYAKKRVIHKLNQLSYEELRVIDAMTGAILGLRKPLAIEQHDYEAIMARVRDADRQDPMMAP